MQPRQRKRLYGIVGIILLVALAAWVDSPKHPRINLPGFVRDLNIRLGLDLQGGSQLVYRADVKGISSDQITDAMAGVRDVIERRVNAFGISEPVIETSKVGDEPHVIVQLAGIADPQEAIKLIGETPQLDFRREITPEEAAKQFDLKSADQISGPVFERTELSGKNLKRATVTFDSALGQPQVNLEFDGTGAQLFADLTKSSIGRRIAIYLDSEAISAPVVQSEITDGKAVISGGFSLDEAKQLVQRLNAGALPIPIELISQQTIGPSLGRLSIKQSIAAGILGLIAVIVFMLVYYRLPGLVASIALVIYALLLIAIIKLLPVTLTLAGIAGFILSIGMAVDANILIFERLRENLRDGKTMAYSLDNGFKGAWSSINTSNMSSLMIGIIMYAMGTSIIRGFALTLSLGIILSLFTAVVVTRTLLFAIMEYPIFQKPSLLAIKPEKKPV